FESSGRSLTPRKWTVGKSTG
ncbi:unnamed protein product, partial [Allacma fusca]